VPTVSSVASAGCGFCFAGEYEAACAAAGEAGMEGL
jgi:hypothetical protein